MNDEMKKYSYLSGASFYMLLVESKRGREIHNYQILAELSKIFLNIEDVFFQDKQAVEHASKYRSGDLKAPIYLGFYDQKNLSQFDERVASDAVAVLARIDEFVNDYLYIDKDDPWLIYALFDLIINDERIADDEIIYTDDEGENVCKSDLINCMHVSIPRVLLGVWLYTLKHTDDRVKVKETYKEWTKQERDGSRTVKREVFSWDKKIELKEFAIPADYTPINKENPVEQPAEVEEENVEWMGKTAYYVPTDDIAPDMAEFDPENIVIVEHGRIKKHQTSYDLYLENIKKKHSKVYNFLYKAERPMSSFYVCNDLLMTSGGWMDASNFMDIYKINNAEIDKLSFSQSQKFIITAEGGMGKSMMLHHLTVSAVERFESFKHIPIFITARLFSQIHTDFFSFVFSEFNRHNPELGMNDLKELLLSKSALLLIDGLDEISAERLNLFFDELERFMDQYQDNYIVVSTRKHVHSKLFSDFTTYELQPLNFEQAIEVVSRIDSNYLGENITRDFISDLRNKKNGLDWEKQKEFLGNPLLLTIMILAYGEDYEIPTKRFAFFENAYDALASKHDISKGFVRDFKCGLDKREFKLLFGEFCANAYDLDELHFKEDTLYGYIDEVITANGYCVAVDDVISDIVDKLCLMFKEGDTYHFIHKSFMEYFAAYFFSKQDARYYKPIYDTFMKYDESRHDDETLSMLFGMAQQQTELHIILPFLEYLLEFKYNYVGNERPKDNFFEFLEMVYPCLYFYYGDYNCENYMEDSDSAMYNFIRDNYGLAKPKLLEDPGIIDESFALHKYYYCPGVLNLNAEEGKENLFELQDLDEDIIKIEIDPTKRPDGIIYEVPLSTLTSEADHYMSILEYIFSNDFELRNEYQKVIELRDRLKKKYENREDEAGSFISKFH